MKFFAKFDNNGNIVEEAGLEKFDICQDNGVIFYSKKISRWTLEHLKAAYDGGDLGGVLDKVDDQKFLLIIVDQNKKNVLLINDKFGTNNIFYMKKNERFFVSNRMEYLHGGSKPKIDTTSLYEVLTLFTIMPPRTIYKNMSSLPMASVVTVGMESGSIDVFRYWDVEKRLSEKEFVYRKHLQGLRASFENVLDDLKSKVGVSLSGGIDSGVILNILSRKLKDNIPSITFGGHGRNTPDLESSRLTAREAGSENYELYPSFTALKKLPDYMSNLEQPISGDTVYPNCMIFEKSRDLDIETMCFGYGAEMLLGSLKISKVYRKINLFDVLTPGIIKEIVIDVISRLFKLSKNQRDFLMADNWTKRFILARAPLLTRERCLYKKIPTNFIEILEEEMDEKVPNLNNAQDRFVMLYLFSWVGYMQQRDFTAMGQQFGVSTFSPFDTPEVTDVLFKTPNKIRKLNKWNKQVLRDMARPYISERLYNRKIRSLIVPYTEFFKGSEQHFWDYLKSSRFICEHIDMERFVRNYHNLPEPGLTMMRILGVAVWHDSHWDKVNLRKFEKACEVSQSESEKWS